MPRKEPIISAFGLKMKFFSAATIGLALLGAANTVGADVSTVRYLD